MGYTVTQRGQRLALGTLAGGGIIQVATKAKLYKSGSSPNKDGSGFQEVDAGFGYTAGGTAIVAGNWVETLVLGNYTADLKPSGAWPHWTAVGGNIANIAGFFITDAADNVLAWWPNPGGVRTLASGESIYVQATLGAN
jgi:hypothetical protein